MFWGGWRGIISGIQVVSSLLAVATIGFENDEFTVNEGAGMQDDLIIKDIVSEQTLVILVDLSVGTSLDNPAVPG